MTQMANSLTNSALTQINSSQGVEPSSLPKQEKLTRKINAIAVILLVLALLLTALPTIPFSFETKTRARDPQTGRNKTTVVAQTGQMSAMEYVWKPYTDRGVGFTAEMGEQLKGTNETYDISQVASIPLLLLFITVLVAIFSLLMYKTYFSMAIIMTGAVFGIVAQFISPLFAMQRHRMIIIAICVAAFAVAIYSAFTHTRLQAMRKADPKYKLMVNYQMPLGAHVRKNWMMYSFLIIPIGYFVLFKYLPMAGNVIAFRYYKGGPNILGTGWLGLEYFDKFIQQTDFWRAFRNTLELSVKYLIVRFPLTLIFALLLNEMRHVKAKKLVQTISYLPHFISTVILVGMVKEMVAMTGPINLLTKLFGGNTIPFIQKPEWFHSLYIVSGVWQGLGWGTILYLAAMTGINTELYEAAEIDGATRFDKVMNVTLPGILPTISTLLVLDIGGIMGSNFEKVLLMYNELTYETADVISTYVYRMGITGGMFSFSTAIGLFEGIIGLVLVSSANIVSRKLTDTSLW